MKKPALILAPILALVLAGSLFLLKGRFWRQPEPVPIPTPTPGSHFSLPEEKEQGAEVSLTPRYDKKAVVLKISKVRSDVISIEYELSYEAKGGLPRGVLGKVDVKSGQETILREILLGTCSKNVCVYDEGVKKVSLTLRFNKSSGESTGFSQEYEL